MIGQKKLLEQINRQLEADTFPRFSIIAGAEGSGKTTLALEISKSLCYYPTVIDDVSIENIRNIITTAYNTVDTQVYIIRNADNMSVSAKNSMLKVLEEPPTNSYFILTCNNIYVMPNTILSRARIYNMEQYTQKEMAEYLGNKKVENKELILKIAQMPGDINTMLNYDIKELYDFTSLVIDNIATASESNALKIGKRLALKKDSEGFDLRIFWHTFIIVCLERAINEPKYTRWALITSKKLNELFRTPSINKTSLFDVWVLDIRENDE